MVPPARIDAVLPLTARDFERARILLWSLQRFFVDLGTLWVVVPDRDVAAARDVFSWEHVRVRSESEVLPGLGFYRRLFRATVVYRRRPDGWYVQQIVKLAAPAYVDTDFYLTLDADVVCVRTIRASDLVVDGRAICMRGNPNRNEEWYLWSQRVLGLPRSRTSHGATPLLYSKEAMTRMHRFLESRAHGLWRRLGKWLANLDAQHPLTTWDGYLLRNLPWAEHALYHTFLEAHDLYDRYHWDARTRPLHAEDSVWFAAEFERWNPSTLVAPDGPFFAIVQSWLGIPPAQVWARLAPHLDATLEWPPRKAAISSR